MKIKLLLFYAFTCTLFVILIKYGNIQKFQLSAISSLLISSLLFLVIIEYFQPKYNNVEINFVEKIDKKNVWLIQCLLIIFSLLNFFVVFNNSDFDSINSKLNFNFKSMLTATSIPLIITAQFGGWFYQTLSAYFLAILLDVDISLRSLFKITGIAYIGFVAAAFIILLLNTFIFEIPNDFESANQFLSTSVITISLSKAGDFLTSTLIVYGILLKTKISYKKAFIISILPGILLLSILQLIHK